MNILTYLGGDITIIKINCVYSKFGIGNLREDEVELLEVFQMILREDHIVFDFNISIVLTI